MLYYSLHSNIIFSPIWYWSGWRHYNSLRTILVNGIQSKNIKNSTWTTNLLLEANTNVNVKKVLLYLIFFIIIFSFKKGSSLNYITQEKCLQTQIFASRNLWTVNNGFLSEDVQTTMNHSQNFNQIKFVNWSVAKTSLMTIFSGNQN